MTRSIPALALAAILLPIAVQAGHHDDPDWESPSRSTVVDGNLVDVQIQVDGTTAPLYFSPRWADQRRYFEAFAGRNYSLVVHNRSGRRVGVLIAVDGLNVVDGERTRLSSREAMYVLDPYERAEIRGWRTSLDHVRRFVFVDEARSYAERTGQANGDMGWIRVLSFAEHVEFRDWQGGEMRRQESEGDADASPPPATEERAHKPASPSLGQDGAAPSKQALRDAPAAPGTGWGDRRYDPVRSTRFIPDGPAVDHLVLRYEYGSGLLALGIEPRRGRSRERVRDRDRDGEFGFAQPPRR